MSTVPTGAQVASHEVFGARQCAVVKLRDMHGAERHIVVRIGPGKDPCPCCGRGWPVNAEGGVDVAAVITAEQASMDAAAAAVSAYAAKHGCAIVGAD